MKCLDLINCYFLVIFENKKQIPIDFNYNYFYTGIRCILESNHSVLLQLVSFALFRCYQFCINITIFSPNNSKKSSIIILSIMSLTSYLCIGINKSGIFSIFSSSLKSVKLRLIILKIMPKWVLACIKKEVIILNSSMIMSNILEKWREMTRKLRRFRRRSTFRGWRKNWLRGRKNTYSKADHPFPLLILSKLVQSRAFPTTMTPSNSSLRLPRGNGVWSAATTSNDLTPQSRKWGTFRHLWRNSMRQGWRRTQRG